MYDCNNYKQPSLGPDETPVRRYTVRLSDREIQSLKSLKNRNYSGLVLGIVNEAAAITKVVNQITDDDDTLDNYD